MALQDIRDSERCVVCKKKFEANDRVTMVFVVEKVGRNLELGGMMGAWLKEQFELAHANCADPKLQATILGVK